MEGLAGEAVQTTQSWPNVGRGQRSSPTMLQGPPTGLAPHRMVMILTIRAYLATSPGARERAGEMAHCQHPK